MSQLAFEAEKSATIDLKIELTKIYQDEDQENKNLGSEQSKTEAIIALKNKSSFLISRKKKKFEIIESGIIVYSKDLRNLPEDGPFTVSDAIYVAEDNSYYLCLNNKLYRKDIGQNPPVLHMSIEFGSYLGLCFRYSKINKRMILAKDYEDLVILNLKTRKIENSLKKLNEDFLIDFSFIGEDENRIVVLSDTGYLIFYKYGSSLKESPVELHHKIEVDSAQNEAASCLAICDKGSLVCVELVLFKNDENVIFSRYVILQLLDDQESPSVTIKANFIGTGAELPPCSFLTPLSSSHSEVAMFLALSEGPDGLISLVLINRIGRLERLRN